MQPVGKDGGNNYIPGLELIEIDQLSDRFRLNLNDTMRKELKTKSGDSLSQKLRLGFIG